MLERNLIALLGLLGWGVSYAFFGHWLAENGGDFLGGWVEAFTASAFATGLLMDLVATTWILLVVAWFERRRLGTAWAAAMVASLALSVSMSLAIYLVRCLQLELQRQREGTTATSA